MAGKGKGGGKRRRGRPSGKEFMDAALDGYIRDIALRRWRDYEELCDVHGPESSEALAETGAPLGIGPYQAFWREAWSRHVWPGQGSAEQHLFGRMENAVREALLAESEARAEQGDVAIEDTPGYQQFVRRAMDNLYMEASGEIEELD